MARVHYWQYIVDEEGRPISGVDVTFYSVFVDDGDPTTNTQANIYANSTVGHQTTTGAIGLETNQDGYFEFWVGDEWELNGGYPSTQKFSLSWYKAGMTRGRIDNIDIYPPLYQVDETAAGQVITTEAERRNKLINNALAYRWEQHVEAVVSGSTYRVDAPHDIQPVIVCDTDTEYNRVVSNELMNKIYTLAVSASTVSLDASAADIDFSDIPEDHPLLPSGGDLYYSIVNHNIPTGACPGVSNIFPMVQVVDRSDSTLMIPETIQAIDANNTKIVFTFTAASAASAALFTVTTIG